MRALISCDWYALPSMSIFQSVPMWRFTDRIVRSGLVIACRLATSPTSTSPVFENATTDGVVRAPSALGMTTGSPPSSTDTTELVVPRSMPTALAMVAVLLVSGRTSASAEHAIQATPNCATDESENLSRYDSSQVLGPERVRQEVGDRRRQQPSADRRRVHGRRRLRELT